MARCRTLCSSCKKEDALGSEINRLTSILVDPNLCSDCALKESCPGLEEAECEAEANEATETEAKADFDNGVESSSSSSSSSSAVNAIEANGAMSRTVNPQSRCCCGCGKDASDSRYRCFVSGKRMTELCQDEDGGGVCVNCTSRIDETPTVISPCCCGCGAEALLSHHTCSVTGKKMMGFCQLEGIEGFGSNSPCVGCNKNKAGKTDCDYLTLPGQLSEVF